MHHIVARPILAGSYHRAIFYALYTHLLAYEIACASKVDTPHWHRNVPHNLNNAHEKCYLFTISS